MRRSATIDEVHHGVWPDDIDRGWERRIVHKLPRLEVQTGGIALSSALDIRGDRGQVIRST